MEININYYLYKNGQQKLLCSHDTYSTRCVRILAKHDCGADPPWGAPPQCRSSPSANYATQLNYAPEWHY